MENGAPTPSSCDGHQGGGFPHHFDDPFFRDHNPFRHEQFGPTSPRRTFAGSNPRLFDDDEFFNSAFGDEPAFFRSSLPRRPPPNFGNTSNSSQRFSRPHPNAGFEREIPIHRQQSQSQSPNQSRKSPTPSGRFHFPSSTHQPSSEWNNVQQNTSQPFHQRQSSAGANLSGASPNHQMGSTGGGRDFIEINNANPDSYTHGELNPDKRRRFSNASHASSNEPTRQQVPIVIVDDYSSVKSAQPSPNRGAVTPAISETAIPLPPPPGVEIGDQQAEFSSPETKCEVDAVVEMDGSQEEEETQAEENERKFTPLAASSEHLIGLLDEAERRVEQLRETASQLEQEKETLMDILNNVKMNTELLKLTKGDQDELNMTTERIRKRCQAVEVAINTPRSEQQMRALGEVNQLIHAVSSKMHDDLAASKQIIQGFFYACSSEDDGPIDEKFQRMIVECTADDQKKIRRKLALLISQIERAEKTTTCNL